MKNIDKKNKRIIVLSGFRFDPTPDGRLTSLTNTLIWDYQIMKIINEYMLEGVVKNARKSLIAEVPENKPDIEPWYMMGMYADSYHTDTSKLIIPDFHRMALKATSFTLCSTIAIQTMGCSQRTLQSRYICSQAIAGAVSQRVGRQPLWK